MTLKQLENLIEIDQDITDDAYGTYYDKRTIEQLLNQIQMYHHQNQSCIIFCTTLYSCQIVLL